MKSPKKIQFFLFVIVIIILTVTIILIKNNINNPQAISEKSNGNEKANEETNIVTISANTSLNETAVPLKNSSSSTQKEIFNVNDLNRLMLYNSCRAWKNKNSSLCIIQKDQINIAAEFKNYIFAEEQNCIEYYYENFMFIEKNTSYCEKIASLNNQQICKDKALKIGNFEKLSSKEEITNFCNINAGDEGKYECIALFTSDKSYCDKMVCQDKLTCDYHIQNCIIFSSQADDLDCDKFLSITI